MSRPGAIPFRRIAIVGDQEGVADICLLAREYSTEAFGLMLRDPEHRRDVLERLARHALAMNIPENLTLITNSYSVPGIGFLHRTSAQLAEEEYQEEKEGIIIGYSVHDVTEAQRAVDAGAAYVIFSPIFPTASKPGHPGAGLEMLRQLCSAISIPVFALGGITHERIQSVLDVGAYGVASISLFKKRKGAKA